MFQLNKQNTVKMVGGVGDQGPHKKKKHNKQLEWNKLDVQQYKMYTNAYVQ